jgi:hypothetical protein
MAFPGICVYPEGSEEREVQTKGHYKWLSIFLLAPLALD